MDSASSEVDAASGSAATFQHTFCDTATSSWIAQSGAAWVGTTSAVNPVETTGWIKVTADFTWGGGVKRGFQLLGTTTHQGRNYTEIQGTATSAEATAKFKIIGYPNGGTGTTVNIPATLAAPYRSYSLVGTNANDDQPISATTRTNDALGHASLPLPDTTTSLVRIETISWAQTANNGTNYAEALAGYKVVNGNPVRNQIKIADTAMQQRTDQGP